MLDVARSDRSSINDLYPSSAVEWEERDLINAMPEAPVSMSVWVWMIWSFFVRVEAMTK